MKKIDFFHKSVGKGRPAGSALPARSVRTAAFAYVGVKGNEVRQWDLVFKDGLYEAVFSTDWLCYDIFVDSGSGEVIGCDFEPLAV